jgi:hypothetical protein
MKMDLQSVCFCANWLAVNCNARLEYSADTQNSPNAGEQNNRPLTKHIIDKE